MSVLRRPNTASMCLESQSLASRSGFDVELPVMAGIEERDAQPRIVRSQAVSLERPPPNRARITREAVSRRTFTAIDGNCKTSGGDRCWRCNAALFDGGTSTILDRPGRASERRPSGAPGSPALSGAGLATPLGFFVPRVTLTFGTVLSPSPPPAGTHSPQLKGQ